MILKQFWVQKQKKIYVRHSDNFFLTKCGIFTNSNSNVFTHISYNFWFTQTYYTSFSSSEIVELMISLTESSSGYGFWATVQNTSPIFLMQTLWIIWTAPQKGICFFWPFAIFWHFSQYTLILMILRPSQYAERYF